MPNHIRKIEHKGDLYYSLDDIIDLLKKSKSIDELKSILIPDDNKETGQSLSDFNQKLVQGLNFNPKADKNHFEMRDFPIKFITANGLGIEDRDNELFNLHHADILRCKVELNKRLSPSQTATIYVNVETGKVYYELPDGTTSYHS